MKTFKVFKNSNGDLKAVKNGFAWLAIPFFPWWFLFRRLWLVFASYILIILILASIDYELYGELGFFKFSTANDLQIFIFITEIIILTLPGFRGNEWTVNNLKKRGFLFTYSVQASSKRTALELAKEKEIAQLRSKDKVL